MKRIKWIAVLGIFLIAFSLNTSAKRVSRKNKAQIAYNEGNYAVALALWEKSIAKYERRHKEVKCPYYTKAGMAAIKLKKTDEARQLFEKAIHSVSVSPVAYVELAKIYRKIDNLSLEIFTLENYVKKYPDGGAIEAVRERLFVTYVESENWDEALKLWGKLPEQVKNSIAYKTDYLKVNRTLKNTEVCDRLSSEILRSDPKNVTALDWKAKKYFWLAENRYQTELKIYNKNKTRRRYVELLRAFKVVTVNFKRSLNYFKKLYPLQSTAENANYLGNIYARLNDDAKAKYYHYIAGRKKAARK
jgi:tetratricopeptide (TPR) repeat protein